MNHLISLLRQNRNASLSKVAQLVTMKMSMGSASLAMNTVRHASIHYSNAPSARPITSSNTKVWVV